MTKPRRFSLIVILLIAGAAHAQPGTTPEAQRWERRFENQFAFVLNPVGIQDAFDVSWTRGISTSDALLLKDAHVATGISSKLTPAFGRLGAWFEYSPLSILDLRVGLEPVYYFGTYKAFLPFDRASARFDDEVIESRVKEAAPGFAARIYFAPTLKARAGAVVARTKAEVGLWRAQDRGGAFFYEPAWDTLIKTSGAIVLTWESVLLREFTLKSGNTLLIGPVHDLTKVSHASGNTKQDAGLLGVWSKSGRVHALKDPTVVVKAFYFLRDPWRRHQPAAQFAFAFGL